MGLNKNVNKCERTQTRVIILGAFFVVLTGCLFLYNLGALIAFIKSMTGWLVQTIGKLGYSGIAALMFVESSFIPFPSEVVLPPAGYLAWKGDMSFALVALSGIAGSILGALFNYWLALFLRPFLIKYGKYFLISPDSLEKVDAFFARHGHISTLVGRLLPVIRQLISLPAGVARMRLDTFLIYTSIGAGLWTVLLTSVGYLLGEHQEMLERYLHLLTFACVAFAVALSAGYLLWHRRKASRRAT